MAYIFCASTGRCGTRFLAAVFKKYTDYPSFHEPEPRCIEQVLREVNNKCGITKMTREILNQKMEQIQKDSQNGNYFESNQMFIKSYVERVIYKESFRPLYMIYIERNPIDTLISFVGKLVDFELNWILAPHWGGNQIRLHKGLSAPEQVLYNWFEIRQRYYLYRQKADKSFEIEYEKIGDPKEIEKMFNYFGIEYKELPDKFDFYHKIRNATPPAKYLDCFKSSHSLSPEKIILLNFLLENWKHRGHRKSVSAQDSFLRRMEERNKTKEGDIT